MASFLYADFVVILVTIIISLLNLYYIIRQRLDRVFDAKMLVGIVYISLMGGLVLEFLRDLFDSDAFMTVYILSEISIILLMVMSLAAIAYVTYVHPPESSFSQRLRAAFEKRLVPHGLSLVAIGVYAIFSATYVVVFKPFTFMFVSSGSTVLGAVEFNSAFTVILFTLFAVYLAYPATIFTLASRKALTEAERRTILVIVAASTVMGVDFLLSNYLSLSMGTLGVLINHCVIGITLIGTAVVFRKVTVLGNIFESGPLTTILATSSFSDALGIEPSKIKDAEMLLEIDSGANYERVVKDFVLEQMSHEKLAFIFTYASSPVQRSLSNLPEARFYVSTGSVTHAKATDNPHKVMIPAHDSSVVLDLLQRTLASSSDNPPSIVFDSLSDWLLSVNFEATIKLLKQMLEMLGTAGANSLFLITSGAHDEKLVNYIRSLFPNLLTCGVTLKSVKLA